MIDAKRLLDQLVGSGVAGGMAGGLAAGAMVQALSGKKAKKLAGSALQLGGLALVGGLAYKAWQGYQKQTAGNGHVEHTPPAAFLPDSNNTTETHSLSVLLTRAIIAAAKADGQIDAEESQKILDQINGLELASEDKMFLLEEYGRPLDIRGLVDSVDTPEHAVEVYAASLLTLDPPTPAEKAYLDTLAQELGLATALVNEIHAAAQQNRAAA